MTRKSCEEIGEQLHAYRAGELGPLERERVEAHLNHCAECATELAMLSSLVEAARLGPQAMSWERKRHIELRLFEHLAAPQKATKEARGWRWWPVIFIPSFAAGAALMALLFTLVAKEPAAVATGWLPTEYGVRAFAPQAAEVDFDIENQAPHLRLRDKAVLVRYQRPAQAGILSVSTPHGEVLVKGTVFFVDVDADKSVVGVQRGVVELVAQDGSSVAVHPGEQAELSAAGAVLVEAHSSHFAMLDILFPRPIELEPVVATPDPSPRQVNVEVDPGPDSKAIAAVVQKRQWLIQECYQHALKRDASLGGVFEVEIDISTAGDVTGFRITADELGSSQVADCVRERMLKWTFPAHPRDEMTISVPFVFNRTPYKMPK